jgi:gliding motility-associated-like protein
LFYTATLNATNSFGCTSSYSHTYAVYPTPTALFSINPGNTQIYPAVTIQVVNSTANASSFHNNWNFGDGSTSSVVSPPNHTYATWGTYTITLVVSSTYCKDSVTQVEVIIPPKPIASFTGCTKGCVPLKDSLRSTSQYATSYYWSFGDPLGGSASIANPTYIYTQPGTYNIKLVVTGQGGKDSITTNACAIVYPNPIASFSIQPISAQVTIGIDAVTTYYNSSITSILAPESISTYSWNFGDGSPDITTKNASHIYQQPGQFAVTLIVASNHGCKDTFEYYSRITVIEQFNLQVPNAFTPNPNGSSGDGIYDPASHDNDIFHPNISGLQTYELDIFDRWGELIFVSKDIRVGWDGYYKGKLCEQSIYVWKIIGTTIDGKNINKAGDLTLLR